MRTACFLGLILIIYGCKSDVDQHNEIDNYSYNLGVVGGFSELVAAGVKKMAFSSPMKPEEMDEFVEEAEKTAARHGVSVFRERNLIVTDLFPKDVAEGMDVLLLYKGTALEVYQQLKLDREKLQKEGTYAGDKKREIARRLGRLLSYTPQKINNLLAEQTSFRTMENFGIRAHNLFLYYKDLKAAGAFYTQIIGMELVADYKMALILRMSKDSYLILVDAEKGMHSVDEPKSVALALLTDQLDEWYTYLKNQKVKFKYDYQPEEGSAHDGFVIEDPEGYLLEMERFNQHPENEDFIPLLKGNKEKLIRQDPQSQLPEGLHIHATITWLYHKDVLSMEGFYEDVLGLELVADQGWTKIYQISGTSYLAIVDERRGMKKYSEKKAVNVGFILEDLSGWFDYVSNNEVMPLRENTISTGPETRYKAFVGYGPEDYFYEFDAFCPHEDNDLLISYLKDSSP